MPSNIKAEEEEKKRLIMAPSAAPPHAAGSRKWLSERSAFESCYKWRKNTWPEEQESEIKNDISSESVEELENDKIDTKPDKQINEKENLSEKSIKSKTPEEIKPEKTKSKKASKPKKDKGPTTVEWDLTKKNSKDDQMKLFWFLWFIVFNLIAFYPMSLLISTGMLWFFIY